MKPYDCAIVGGGPAGLSAAIYLARFNRRVIVIDKRGGRSAFSQINENYLGFPNGISAKKLRTLGKAQAKKFGAQFVYDTIETAKHNENIFTIQGKNIYQSKTLVIATGVKDDFPDFEQYRNYVGKSLFWCIMCDGYKTIGKRVAVIGNNDESAATCMQFLNFTSKLIFITDPSKSLISEGKRKQLEKADIPVYEEEIATLSGMNGKIKSLHLAKGKKLSIDFIFSQLGQHPNSAIAHQLGVNTDKTGCIIIDEEQRTNIPRIYAAGDVTTKYSQQVVAAAHQGATAAESANYDLYLPKQKE